MGWVCQDLGILLRSLLSNSLQTLGPGAASTLRTFCAVVKSGGVISKPRWEVDPPTNRKISKVTCGQVWAWNRSTARRCLPLTACLQILLLQSLQSSPRQSDLRPGCTTPNQIEQSCHEFRKSLYRSFQEACYGCKSILSFQI